jgi:hypothetical protein
MTLSRRKTLALIGGGVIAAATGAPDTPSPAFRRPLSCPGRRRAAFEIDCATPQT